MVSKVELRQRLNHVSMKKGSDPAILFETLVSIEDQYDGIGAVSETDLIAIVMDVATEEYKAVLTGDQRWKGDNITLCVPEIVMRQHYHQKTQKRVPEVSNPEKSYSLHLVVSAMAAGNEDIWLINAPTVTVKMTIAK